MSSRRWTWTDTCALGLGFAASAWLGCGDDTMVAPAVAPAPLVAGRCPRGEHEKLGVPFVPMCGAAAPTSEWISAIAVPCTGGAHELLGCPLATPLLAEPETTLTRQARSVALMDGETAFRLCAMRFGGRLPTTAERARARQLQGMATLVASRKNDTGTIRLEELAEWVADGECDNPTLPGPRCNVHRFPVDADPTVPWDRLVSCNVVVGAGTTRTDLLVADLGGTCPAIGDCLLRSPLTSRGNEVSTLQCEAAAAPSRPAEPVGRAAVRCVVPAAGLRRVSGP